MKVNVYIIRILGVISCLALCMVFPGCGDIPEAPHSQTPQLKTPQPTLNIFGEVSAHGDIEISGDALAELRPQVYSFAEAPTVLIYHTHATEAFLQDDNYTYVESKEWRTEDNEKNIVHVGEVLKSHLEALGYIVIHDTTNVEPPELLSAYSRSLEVMEKYEGVDIYIDLHRNAADVDTVINNTVMVEGRKCAKMFFVVGTGIGTYEGEYDIAPDWRANYTFAVSVMKKASDIVPGIMKPIRTKVGRYNQHMGMCLLLEIGNNANTMEEVLNALPYFSCAFSATVTFGQSRG
jgi:stage II sporulation protein P